MGYEDGEICKSERKRKKAKESERKRKKAEILSLFVVYVSDL